MGTPTPRRRFRTSPSARRLTPSDDPMAFRPRWSRTAKRSFHGFDDFLDVAVGKLGRERQAHRLAADPHRVGVILRLPAEAILVERMLWDASVVNADADVLGRHR